MNDEPHYVWTDDMSVNSVELDYQHRFMVQIIEEAFQARSKGVLNEEMDNILDRLSQYVVYHFKMEEFYFDMFKYDEKESHISEHNLFRQKIEEFKYRSDIANPALTEDFMKFLEYWLNNHIINADRKYIDCFMKHGLK